MFCQDTIQDLKKHKWLLGIIGSLIGFGFYYLDHQRQEKILQLQEKGHQLQEKILQLQEKILQLQEKDHQRQEEMVRLKSKEYIQMKAVEQLLIFNEPSDISGKMSTIVERPTEEKEIKYAIDTMVQNQSFYLILGNHGAGKSTLVSKVTKGRQGVLNVVIDENTKPEDIMWTVLKACGVTKNMVGDESPLGYFKEICNLSTKQNVSPLVAFEIAQHTQEATFIAATKISKYLTCDAHCSAALLNVSSALLALSMIPDPRCKYIDIGPFTDDQAHLYLNKLEEIGERKLDDDQRKMVFENLGTYPYQLWDVVISPLDPAEYVNYQLEQCKSKIEQSLSKSDKIQLLYDELLKKPFLKGINEYDALSILKTDMNTMGGYIRAYQVLNYDPTAPGHFKFRTKSMERAAKQLKNNTKKAIGRWFVGVGIVVVGVIILRSKFREIST